MMPALPEELFPFLRDSLGEHCDVTPLLGDASNRAYYRISTPAGKRYMLAYYPESSRQDIDRFLRAYQSIANNARVPAVHFHSPSAVIQEDLGDQTLFDLAKRDRSRGIELYRAAIDLLLAFRASPAAAREINPAFNVTKFSDELDQTRRLFVGELVGERRQEIHERLTTVFSRLAQRLTAHPYVLCHRDYHGQNIHVVNGTLYMIDYQDMRMGPDTYDLASLLRDRGIAWILGREAEESLIEYYRARIDATPDLRNRYLETLLQRSIKVLGTFAGLAVRRKKLHYLDFIPAALDSVRFCLDQLPEYADLAELFPVNFEVHPA